MCVLRASENNHTVCETRICNCPIILHCKFWHWIYSVRRKTGTLLNVGLYSASDNFWALRGTKYYTIGNNTRLYFRYRILFCDGNYFNFCEI